MKTVNKQILDSIKKAVEVGMKMATSGRQTIARSHVRRIYQETPDLAIDQDSFVELAVNAYDAAGLNDAERED